MISNSFFAGLESFMEDDKSIEANASVTVAPEEQVAEEAEAEEAAAQQAEDTAEIEQEEQATEMVFAKFAEIDRMIAHVETYGVDRSFLSICNHDNILGNSFGIQLPACESFDAVGDPASIASQEALEGLKNAAVKVWEFIKRMLARLDMFLKRLIKLIPIRLALIKRKLEKLEAVKAEDHTAVSSISGEFYTEGDFESLLNQIAQNARMKTSTKLPEVKASGDLKGAKFENGVKNVQAVKKTVGEIEKGLKDLPKTMKEISDLNVKVAQAERAGDGDEAVALKNQAHEMQKNVSQLNACLSTKISVCGKLLKGAAAIFKATANEKEEEKK